MLTEVDGNVQPVSPGDAIHDQGHAAGGRRLGRIAIALTAASPCDQDAHEERTLATHASKRSACHARASGRNAVPRRRADAMCGFTLDQLPTVTGLRCHCEQNCTQLLGSRLPITAFQQSLRASFVGTERLLGHVPAHRIGQPVVHAVALRARVNAVPRRTPGECPVLLAASLSSPSGGPRSTGDVRDRLSTFP
jgi:hypothetical protein